MALRTGPIFDAELVESEPDITYSLPISVPVLVRAMMSSGVGRGMRVVPTSPTTMSTLVEPGVCNVDGFTLEVHGSGEEIVHPDSASEARFDLVVVQLDRTNRTMTIEPVAGTPGGGIPSLPADAEPLAVVPVPGNAVDLDGDPADWDWRRWAHTAGDRPGDIKFCGAADPGEGWLSCHGQTVDRDRYPDLFETVGTTWGAGNGSTTFRLPDMRGRFPAGAGGTYDVGDAGGANTVTLTAAQMPSHTHAGPSHSHSSGSLSTGNAGNHSHTQNLTRSESVVDHRHFSSARASAGTSTPEASLDVNNNNGEINNAGTHSHSVNGSTAASGTGSTGSAGSGSSHENRPPYRAATFAIRI